VCEVAAEAGYAEVGFAEHVDFDPTDQGYGYFDYQAYSAAVEELREQFVGRLTVLKGIEVDFQARFVEDISRFLGACEFDFVMGSVHYLDGPFIHEDTLPDRPLEETYRIYARETRALIATGLFDILGHLDYVRSRAVGVFQDEELDRFTPLLADLATKAAQGDLVLEVNVKADRPPVPTVDVLRAYLKAGGTGVVVGTDSHRLWQFDGGWDRAVAYLTQVGAPDVALFRGRRRRLSPLVGPSEF